MTREFMVTVCPDPQMLSAYLDGKLDPTERGRIEDHISRCEDCYFVVRETALVWAEAGEETPPGGTERETSGSGEVVQGTFGADAVAPTATPAAEPPVADPRRPKASSFSRYFLPMAATLVVAAGALALWRQSQANADPRAALVAAVGERRFFDARLTGGFKYGPLITPRRGSAGPIPQMAGADWTMLAAAAKVKAEHAGGESARAASAVAAAHLLLGESDEAIRVLEAARVSGASDALILSDLAAAHLQRALSQDRADDYARALDHSTRALEIDPNLKEAQFNQALALEAMGLVNEARKAWTRVEQEESGGWKEEARAALKRLQSQVGFDGKAFDQNLTAAIQADHEASLAAAISASPWLAWQRFEELIGDDSRVVSGDSWNRIGRAFAAATGDQSLLRVSADPLSLAGRRSYAFARREYLADRWSEAGAVFAAVTREPGYRRSVFAPWVDLHLLIVSYQRGEDIDDALHRLRRRVDATRFPLVAARIHWMLSLTAFRASRFAAAEREAHQAGELFRGAGEESGVAFMAALGAQARQSVGQPRLAWRGQMVALRAMSRLPDAPRVRNLLNQASDLAYSDGLDYAGALLDRVALEWALRDRRGVDVAEACIRAARAPRARDRGALLARAAQALEQVTDPVTRHRLSGEVRWQGALVRGETTEPEEWEGIAEWFREQGDVARQAQALGSGGRAWAIQGNPARAARAFASALDLVAASEALRPALNSARAAWTLDVLDGWLEVAPAAIEAQAAGIERYLRAVAGRPSVNRSPTLPAAEVATIVVFGRRDFAVDLWMIRDSGIRRLRALPPAHSLAQTLERAQGLFGGVDGLAGTSTLRLVPVGWARSLPLSAIVAEDPRLSHVRRVVLAQTIEGDAVTVPAAGQAWQVVDASGAGVPLGLPSLARARAEISTFLSLNSAARRAPSLERAQIVSLLRNAGRVYFAGHATFNPDQPGSSALVIGGGAGEPYLTADEIASLPLKGLSTVILSACSTAGGSLVTGYAPLTLAHSFLAAGALQVVAALGDVDDADQEAAMSLLGRSLADHEDRDVPEILLRLQKSRSLDERSRRGLLRLSVWTRA